MSAGLLGIEPLEQMVCCLRDCAQSHLDPWLDADAAEARYWLQQVRDDRQRMMMLREMLSGEPSSFGVHLTGDDRVVQLAAQMLSSGLWRVHSSNKSDASSTDQANIPWQRVPGTAPMQPPSRRAWRLKSRFTDLAIIRAVDLTPGEEFVEKPLFTPIEVAAWSYDLQSQRAVSEICTTLHGDPPVFGSVKPESIQKVESAFAKGTLVLARPGVRTLGAAVGADQSAPAPRPTPAPEKEPPAKTWFRMQLVDEDGEPMANEDYEVIDSSGTLRKGKLNEAGELYIPPMLPVGECSITFPNIHLNPRKRK